MSEFGGLAGAGAFRVVELVCRAQVGTEQVEVHQALPEVALDEPGVQEVIEGVLRHRLVDETLKRWKPHVEIRR